MGAIAFAGSLLEGSSLAKVRFRVRVRVRVRVRGRVRIRVDCLRRKG